MQELEKILAEIDDLIVHSAWPCMNLIEKEKVKEIIRDHIIDKGTDGGWIPVEERLPEEPKENPEFEGKKIELYLVTVKETKYPFRAFWNGKQFTDGWSVLDVIAWRTLPEPYRPVKI